MKMPSSSYPLYWPEGWARHKHRQFSRFSDHLTIARALDGIFIELERLGADRAVISSNLRTRPNGLPAGNQPQPQDPGVAVWFHLKGKPHVLACDKWSKVQHNLWAIVKHIESLRGQDRWGVGSLQQAFAGYAALPEKSSAFGAWHEVLGVAINASEEQIKEAYRIKAMTWHPDRGGDHERMAALNNAYQAALKERGL
ncbi:MAG: J domain-containing protein [Verrucomicrobiota bacterium]